MKRSHRSSTPPPNAARWSLITRRRKCSPVDLQQGIQIFELRIYAAEMGHRMPLRHEIHQLILAGFREHGIDMPFPPFQMRLESPDGLKTGKTLTSAARKRPAGVCKPASTPLPWERGTPSGSIDGKSNHIAQLFCAQRQHHQTIHTQRHARTIRQTRFQGLQQVSINRLLRQTSRGALAVILLKTLLLFAGVGQFVEAIRQLNALVIDLKTLATR